MQAARKKALRAAKAEKKERNAVVKADAVRAARNKGKRV